VRQSPLPSTTRWGNALGQPGAVTELPVTPQRLRDILRAAQTA